MEKRTGRHGRRKVNVPNLSGLTREQAQAELTARGFQYSESSTDTSDSNNTNKISSQSVSAGSTAVFGSTIPFVYFNYVNPITYTYGPCEAYSSSTSYTCIGGNQNQETTTTYRRRQVYANGVWNGTYDECSSTSSTGSAQYTDGRCGYTAPTITYGPCETYGSGTNIGSGTQCSGTYTQSYTDYRYNTRKKIYSNGVWDGTSYTTSGCGQVDERSINSSSQTCGSCGYTCSVTTYGPCEAYGDAVYQTGSGTQCSGTSTQTYVDYAYNARRKIYVDGVWNGYSYDYSGCTTIDQRTVTGSSNTCGSCGYTCTTTWYCTESYPGGGVGNCSYSTATYNNSASGTGYSRSCSTSGYPSCQSTAPTPSCTCNYVDYGSYYFAPECCPSGSPRAGALGGTSSGSCCPNVNKTQKWQCKSYDVTNSASANYYTCYYVGECAANYNSDGSRTVCYV
jgi:hypothetical protein